MIRFLCLQNSHRTSLPRLFALLIALILVLTTAAVANAQQSFKTPDEAADALAKAVRSGEQKNILKVLGADGDDIVSSGDQVADTANRDRFISSYDARHRIAMEGDNKAIVAIGQEDFPFPIPLVRTKGLWQFDTTAGREEILARRIGRNELNAIQACLAYVDAQNDYSAKDRGAGVGVYAQQIISDAGARNGLYWPPSQGEDSPLGALVAKASVEGYRVGGGRAPFHGYYYKILTEQGSAAPGGAIDYVVKGKMIGGFALVAYPAEYENSGIMTFIVNHNGQVFQKDLGRNTARIAERMTEYNPDQTWKKADGSQ